MKGNMKAMGTKVANAKKKVEKVVSKVAKLKGKMK